MKIVLDDQVTERSVRADLAWELFFKSKTEMPKGHGELLLPFANWFWDEMGQRAGRLWKLPKGEATVKTLPQPLEAWELLVGLQWFGPAEAKRGRGGLRSGTMGWSRGVKLC